LNLTEKKILLVDDEEKLLNSISKRISLLGFTPLKASSGIEAIEIAKNTQIDLAIVDLKMPDMDGLVTITKLKEIIPNLKTILLTGYGSEKTKQATEALGSIYFEKDSMGGLWDFIKQSGDEGKIIVIKPPSMISESQGNKNVFDRVETLDIPGQTGTPQSPSTNGIKKNTPRAGSLPKIIGETPHMQRLKKNIERVAEMDCAIIIRGESGTGKELAARTIHNLSYRRDQRFLAFDCGCFSKDFSFAELVTSFEDTSNYYPSKKNKTSFAGTILLDHIENMPKKTQQEMMLLLDGKTGSDDQLMDIRFIVGAHQNLEKKVVEGQFQQELYSRIRAIKMQIPSLRQRKDDLPMLCQYFLSQLNEEFGKKIRYFSKDVFNIFKSYAFPGNIRELKHIIERAVILADGDSITLDHLPERLRSEDKKKPRDENSPFLTIHEMEGKHILKAIEITNGNKSKAAEILGISRAALWRKLRIIGDQKSI
jgi:DNA-binding NtrC family response regulator